METIATVFGRIPKEVTVTLTIMAGHHQRSE